MMSPNATLERLSEAPPTTNTVPPAIENVPSWIDVEYWQEDD